MARPKKNTEIVKFSASPSLVSAIRFCADYEGLSVSELCRKWVTSSCRYYYYDYLKKGEEQKKIAEKCGGINIVANEFCESSEIDEDDYSSPDEKAFYRMACGFSDEDDY